MSIEYTQEAEINAQELAKLFDRSGIRRPTDDLDRLRRMIDGSDLIVTAWDGNKLVGVARSLTDFSYCCYLSDLAVDYDYQKMGIGTELISRVQQAVGDECTVLLVSAPKAVDFYEKIGLEPITTGWMIKRKR